jgi:hypothetical protein
MDNQFLKINQQCLNNLVEINNALPIVETKGDSTMIMYKIRLTLSATLEQMQKDNQVEQIKIDNTKDNDSNPIKKEDK